MTRRSLKWWLFAALIATLVVAITAFSREPKPLFSVRVHVGPGGTNAVVQITNTMGSSVHYFCRYADARMGAPEINVDTLEPHQATLIEISDLGAEIRVNAKRAIGARLDTYVYEPVSRLGIDLQTWDELRFRVTNTTGWMDSRTMD